MNGSRRSSSGIMHEIAPCLSLASHPDGPPVLPTRYDVARDLLASHPNCLLTRMASEPWEHRADRIDTDAWGRVLSAEADEEGIFIERDGGRFRYVLDYLREGRVSPSS